MSLTVAVEHAAWAPVPTPGEELVLARRIEAGVLAREALDHPDGYPELGAGEAELRALVAEGEAARDRFVTANLRLAAMVAGQYAATTGAARSDLFQEGCLGLVMAVQRFDHRRGCRFATYALFWVRAYVGAAAARFLGGADLPTKRAEQLRALRGLEAELTQTLGRAATTAELASAAGRPEQWTARLAGHQAPRSIEDMEVSGLASPEPDPGELVLARDRPGRELLARLDEFERRVLELRLGFADGRPHAYAEVARRLGVSVGRVRRTEERALEVLRGICPQSASVHL